MNIEIRDTALEDRIKKQIQATGAILHGRRDVEELLKDRL